MELGKQRQALREQIQTLKKSVSKGDKKAKKLVAEQVRLLEEQIEALKLSIDQPVIEQSTADDMVVLENDQAKETTKKPSRQEIRKLKKQSEMEKMRQDALNEPSVDVAEIELQKLHQKLIQHQLRIKQIPADGDCLFNAIADQLAIIDAEHEALPKSAAEMRQLAVNQMQKHCGEYLPFLNFDDLYDQSIKTFDQYCQSMLSSCNWGGELELKALSMALNCCIQIYQADAELYNIGSIKNERVVKLSYHKHQYGLGAHYNSLVPLTQK